MLSRSFIDVLFILLLGTIVMLTHSVQLDEVDADLLRLGRDGTRPIDGGDVQVVVVDADGLALGDRRFATPRDLAAELRAGDPVILVVDGAEVTHVQVMAAWETLRESGFDASLGVRGED